MTTWYPTKEFGLLSLFGLVPLLTACGEDADEIDKLLR
jgi:hypothetical protein